MSQAVETDWQQTPTILDRPGYTVRAGNSFDLLLDFTTGITNNAE